MLILLRHVCQTDFEINKKPQNILDFAFFIWLKEKPF